MKSDLKIKANVLIQLFDKNGKHITHREIHNTVTTAGKQGIADQMLASPSLPKGAWMELGTGTGGTTLLNAYIASSRHAVSPATDRSGAVVSYYHTWAAGEGTGAITEAGLFDVVTENTVNMWLYASFAVINKGADDTLAITWTLTVG
jgi:hypothetical protein